MTETKIRKPRSITLDSLIQHVEKQPLENKVKILSELKKFIDADKKNLESQLSLITSI